jgi:hypothetical protein
MNEQKATPTVFTHGESIVFLEQASAVADLLGCVKPEQCDEKTINAAGLLIWNLLDAAREVMVAKDEQKRALAEALCNAAGAGIE